MGKNVFIAWSGDNLEIANRVKLLIEKNGFVGIVGGGDNRLWTVEETVRHQLNKCEYAILIVEKIIINKSAYKFSENVMYEWGYLNSRINDPEKTCVCLINSDVKELPTDVRSFWVKLINKEIPKTLKEKDKFFDSVAAEISDAFFNKIKQPDKDKLLYLVNWDEYKNDIYKYNGLSQISEKLLYGMQAAIYFDETTTLFEKLDNIKTNNLELRSIINCVKAMLSVFIKTNRFTNPISVTQYLDVKDDLKMKYEDSIIDPDLKAWCEILRNDKLQLCYQYAPDNYNRQAYLKKSFEQGLKVVDLIKKQVEKKPVDKQFADLYLAYQYRNLAQIYHDLNKASAAEALSESEEYYRDLSLSKRKSLRQYYKDTYKKDKLFDNLHQEYILALIEFYPFSNDEYIKDNVEGSLDKWEDEIAIKNYIYNQIKQEASEIMHLERNEI